MSEKNIYDPCDCGSGKKFKFCCLSKIKEMLDLPDSELIKRLSSFPIHQCWIDQDGLDIGHPTILITRIMGPQKYFAGVYVVDTYCLGLKKIDLNLRTSYIQIKDFLINFHNEMSKISYEDCRSIILGGIEYAANLGIDPHSDWHLAKGAIEAERDYIKNFAFGKNGKPLYIQGQGDDVNQIINKLRPLIDAKEANYLIEVNE